MYKTYVEYMLCIPWGGGVADSLNDASHLHTTPGRVFSITTPQLYFYIVDPTGTVIGPGLVGTRKRAESGKMCEI